MITKAMKHYNTTYPPTKKGHTEYVCLNTFESTLHEMKIELLNLVAALQLTSTSGLLFLFQVERQRRLERIKQKQSQLQELILQVTCELWNLIISV